MALILFIAFLAFAVAGRIALQYKITGDHGVRPVKRSSSSITLVSSSLLLVSFSAMFSVSLLDALAMLEPRLTLNPLIKIVGIITSLAGITLTIVAQYQMGAAWRIGVDESEKTELIRQGIYALIRNPIYTGVMFFGLGLLLILPNITMLVSLIICCVSIEMHVRYVEEPHLHSLHGEAFQHYVNSSGRYFPKWSRGSSSRS